MLSTFSQNQWAPGCNEFTAAVPALIGAGGPVQGKHILLFFFFCENNFHNFSGKATIIVTRKLVGNIVNNLFSFPTSSWFTYRAYYGRWKRGGIRVYVCIHTPHIKPRTPLLAAILISLPTCHTPAFFIAIGAFLFWQFQRNDLQPTGRKYYWLLLLLYGNVSSVSLIMAPVAMKPIENGALI